MRDGSFTLGRLNGVRIDLHWTAPFLALWFCGTSIPAWVAFFSVITAHEMGHALVIKKCGHYVDRIILGGLGGRCVWVGHATEEDMGWIAWGGVAMQGAIYCAVMLLFALGFTPPPSLAVFVAFFTGTNVMIMAFNLIPIAPLDGERAWPLFSILWRQARREEPRIAFTPRRPPAAKSEHDDNVIPFPGAKSPEEEESDAEAKEKHFESIIGDVLSATKESPKKKGPDEKKKDDDDET